VALFWAYGTGVLAQGNRSMSSSSDGLSALPCGAYAAAEDSVDGAGLAASLAPL